MAVSTAAVVSSGGLWKTPNPRTGIATPLFSVKVRGLVFVVIVIRLLLGLDLELEDFALVHQPVDLGYLVEGAGSVEDAARLDASFEHVREQLFDVGARRRRAAADRDVVVEGLHRRWDLLVLRDTDATDGAAGADDPERRLDGLVVAYALQHRVRAEAAGQLADTLDGLVAAFADDVGRAEVAAERYPVGVAAEQD